MNIYRSARLAEVHRINEAVASLPGHEDFLFQVPFTHFAKFKRGSCGDTFHLHFKFLSLLNMTLSVQSELS